MTDLYRQKKYDQIITLFEGLNPALHNEESLYYLALSYVHQNEYEKAKKIVLDLLSKDPSFYIYRINFDLDFDPLVTKTGLKKSFSNYNRGSILARRPIKGHEIHW